MVTKENHKEQDIPKIAEDKKSIMNWIEAHKKQLILIGISIPTLIAIVLSIDPCRNNSCHRSSSIPDRRRPYILP